MESFIEGIDWTVLVEAGKTFQFHDGVFNYQSQNAPFNGVFIDQVLSGTLQFDGVEVTTGQFVDFSDFGKLTWTADGKPTGTIEVISFRASALGGITDDDANIVSFEIDVREVISGTKRSETVKGTNTRDIIDGGAGNDKLIGGQLDDVFRFKTGYGKDTITDGVFESSASDMIDLTGLKAVTSYGDLMDHHLELRGDDIWISAGKDVLILKDVVLDDLDKGDFIF